MWSIFLFTQDEEEENASMSSKEKQYSYAANRSEAALLCCGDNFQYKKW